jgi:adenosylmethionine-8-amino-7-oxononanoate aminotransferase
MPFLWSVAPDLIAAGKGMGSGYFPMAACLVSDKVADTMQARGSAFEGVHRGLIVYPGHGTMDGAAGDHPQT